MNWGFHSPLKAFPDLSLSNLSYHIKTIGKDGEETLRPRRAQTRRKQPTSSPYFVVQQKLGRECLILARGLGATHSKEAQRAYFFLNFFKNFDFSLLCPRLLCVHGGAPASSHHPPSIWQPSCGLPGGYSCSCFRFRSWPMIGNQAETRQVP